MTTTRTSTSHRYADVTEAIQLPSNIHYTQGENFDTISFGKSTKLFRKNSILLIPNILSSKECSQLVKECEKRVQYQDRNPGSWLATSENNHQTIAFERFELKDLSKKTQSFFHNIVLRERLLPFISNNMPPEIEESLWKSRKVVWTDPYVPLWDTTDQAERKENEEEKENEKEKEKERNNVRSEIRQELENESNGEHTDVKIAVGASAMNGKRNLTAQHFKFSDSEPTINRYNKGGKFPPHRDALSLTISIVLSDDFTGGGTSFWEEFDGLPITANITKSNDNVKYGNDDGGNSIIPEHAVNRKESIKPSICVLPKIGVGCIFNGTVKHAGRAVTEGVRHLLVASFSIVEHEERPLTAELVAERNAQGEMYDAEAERLKQRLIAHRNKRRNNNNAAEGNEGSVASDVGF